MWMVSALRERSVDYVGLRSLPFLDTAGSVHAERSKQHGRRLPPLILEILTSTRRRRLAGFAVALT